MKTPRLPEGLYLQWIEEYKREHGDQQDPWDKYQFLRRRTQQYLKSERQRDPS